jgi:hypothetical protein
MGVARTVSSEATTMKRNISALDRTFRVILGLAVLALYFVGPKTSWGLLGLIPLATAAINFCPLYAALGFTTRRSENATQS